MQKVHRALRVPPTAGLAHSCRGRNARPPVGAEASPQDFDARAGTVLAAESARTLRRGPSPAARGEERHPRAAGVIDLVAAARVAVGATSLSSAPTGSSPALNDLSVGTSNSARVRRTSPPARRTSPPARPNLADGTGTLADGSETLASGASDLADGTAELSEGNALVAEGSATLATGGGRGLPATMVPWILVALGLGAAAIAGWITHRVRFARRESVTA